MTKRFILVDSALDGPGGHYSTYARHILDAARDAGFATRLVTRRDSPGPFPGDHLVVPVLRRSFVRNFVDTAGLGAPVLAEALSLASQQRDRWAPPSGGSGGARRLLRAAGLLGALAPALGSVLKRRFTSLSLREAAAVFAADLEAALGAMDTWSTDDLVFMPTAFAVEALGVARLAEKGTATGMAWRLLFRRDPGIEPHTSEPVMALRRRRLDHALQALERKQSVRLLTDTEELTALYRDLFRTTFATATIPVIPITREAPRPGPLNIAYLGDARSEKGFHLLPDVVAGAAPAEGFHYLVQANPNTITGEPACLAARARLAGKANVSLLDGPLSDREYTTALMKSDAVILPYDPLIYRARSSGIFAEALAAGIPVIVTAGSWMAAQLQPMEQSWLKGLISERLEHPSEHFQLVTVTAPAATRRLTLVGRSTDGRVVARRTRKYADRLHFLMPSRFEGAALQYHLLCERGMVLAGKFEINAIADDTPSSAVGLIVEPDAPSITAGLEQLQRHYAHFSKTAKENMPGWIDGHKPALLLGDIVS